MKNRFATTIALTAILGLVANSAFATTYNFLDNWIDWGGTASGTTYDSGHTDDIIGDPEVVSMDVTVEGGYLTRVDINLGTTSTRLTYDSLFINTSYDGTNWDYWDHFVRDENTYSRSTTTIGSEAADGFYAVTDPSSYDYTIAIDDQGTNVRDNNPNGIDSTDLGAALSTSLYSVSFSTNTISYTFNPNYLILTGGFFVAYSPWCANDVIGGGAPVPEPATMLLFGTGLIGLLGFARKRNKK